MNRDKCKDQLNKQLRYSMAVKSAEMTRSKKTLPPLRITCTDEYFLQGDNYYMEIPQDSAKT